MIHFIKKEETLKKKCQLSKNFNFLIDLKEKKEIKFKEFIEDIKKGNEITLFEILDEDEEFTNFNFFQLKKIGKLGIGGFAEVWKVMDKKKIDFALKIFIEEKKHLQTEKELDSFINMFNEYQIIYNLRHPSIVHVFGLAYSLKNKTLGIVEELMQLDLRTFLKKNKKILNFNQKLNISIHICNAFLFVHSRKFVHHDVKPGNILISEKMNEFELKLSDFGTCLKILKFSDLDDEDERFLSGISVHYASPESILHCCFGEPLINDSKSDIWSLGILFYKIFVSEKNVVFPWSYLFQYKTKTSYPNQIKLVILDEKEKPINKYLNKREKIEPLKTITELINECLQVEKERRPDISKILEIFTILENNLKPKYS